MAERELILRSHVEQHHRFLTQAPYELAARHRIERIASVEVLSDDLLCLRDVGLGHPA